MNRGSPECPPEARSSYGQVRFNEAPIHESGKWASRLKAILEPASATCASMRPRFMNRGSQAEDGGSISGGVLRFNEAPIHESGK